ncbi:MAG: XdhC family protein [Pseudomonadota bacterium]
MTGREADVLEQAQTWVAGGKRVALATVVSTWGSAPRPLGSQMAIAETGDFAGSVSGGCVEGAVIHDAMAVLAQGRPKLVSFGVSHADAFEVGLACGGEIQIFIEPVAAASAEPLKVLSENGAGDT